MKTENIAELKQTSFSDLDDMRAKGKIVAVTDYSSTNYFIYKGQPMGFHYELLKSFSDFSGLDIEIVSEKDINKSIEMLLSGKADIMAIDLASSPDREKTIIFSEPVSRAKQVLIQRKPNRWSFMTDEEISRSLVTDVRNLAGKTVYVQAGSSAADCLKDINETLGNRITVVEIPYETENIISLVAKREIDYAVCDENIALVNAGYFPVLDVKTNLTAEKDLGWGLRKINSGKLAGELNRWISTVRKSDYYALLYAKYFKNSWSAYIVKSDYYTLNTGKVSPFDKQIKSFSDTIQWDWRLLASLIFQESRFNPTITSNQGAYGLMQVMPSTGESLGIDIRSTPENNIRAGVMYIKYLKDFFSDKIPDEDERLKFVLAAYNAGEGNIIDAMRLAEKNGKDPLKWDNNVAYYLLRKTDPVYYNDPVVQYGYCRGYESVNFVSEILTRFSEYKYIIP